MRPSAREAGAERRGMVVRYKGHDAVAEAQIRWGDVSDPRAVLTQGAVYEVVEVRPTALVPHYVFKDYPDAVWNSVHFEPVEPEGAPEHDIQTL
jgi:hypothetical protein